jgi:hypothetical protein
MAERQIETSVVLAAKEWFTWEMYSTISLQADIFSRLRKYCGEQEEHYVVEAFAFVLNRLLLSDHLPDREVALDILARLADLAFDSKDEIEVVAQRPAGAAGIPDITVKCPDKLVLVEVKVEVEAEAPVDSEQLRKYKRFLESSGTKLCKLILLTKYHLSLDELDEELGKHVKQVRWYEVRQWLSEAGVKIRDGVSKYLVNSFTTFLKEGGISMEKVDGDYRMLKYALPQLRNLLDIMGEVAEKVGRPKIDMARGGWAGFYDPSDENRWFGVTFGHPLDLTFELSNASAYDLSALDTALRHKLPVHLCKYQKEEGNTHYFRWNLEEHAFFSLNRDDQVEMVGSFVKACCEAAEASKRP